MPANGVIKVVSAGGGTDDALLSYESLTTPLSLWFVSAETTSPKILEGARRLRRVGRGGRAAVRDVGTERDPPLRDGAEVGAGARPAPTIIQYAYGGFLRRRCRCTTRTRRRPQHGRAGPASSG